MMKRLLCAALTALMLAAAGSLAEEFFAEEPESGDAGGAFFSEDFFAEEPAEGAAEPAEVTAEPAEEESAEGEAEEEPAAAPGEAEERAAEGGLTLQQTGKGTVALSWSKVTGAKSYAVYDGETKAAVTTARSVTLKKQAEGVHTYTVTPCSDKKGKKEIPAESVSAGMKVIDWDWSGKGSVVLTLDQPVKIAPQGDLTWTYSGNGDIDGFLLTVTNRFGTTTETLPADRRSYEGIRLEYGTNTFTLQPVNYDVLGDAATVTKKITTAWMKPVKPSVTFLEENGSVTLQAKWKAVKGTSGYDLTVADESGENSYFLYETKLEIPAEYDVKYQVTLCAERGNLTGTPSKTLTVFCLSDPAARITSSGTDDFIDVCWEANRIADGYRIYRDGKLIADVGRESTEYTDMKASAGVLHSYRVEAYVVQDGKKYGGGKGAAAYGFCKVEEKATLRFGRYPYTREGGTRPITWTVLKLEEDRALLISAYGVDAQPFNKEEEDAPWPDCSLRAWLNGDFLNRAFTAGEQTRIQVTAVDNGTDQHYSSYAATGKDYGETDDRIFLLSYAEAQEFYGIGPYNKEKAGVIGARTVPTPYAARRAHVYKAFRTKKGKPAGSWWLRSPGSRLCRAAYVYADGSLLDTYVNRVYGMVRPVLWLDLAPQE